MTTEIDDADHAYVAFVRQMLDDMAAGMDYPPDHYIRLFPACADRIREDVRSRGAAEDPGLTDDEAADLASAETAVRNTLAFHDGDAGAQSLPERVGKYPVVGELSVGGMGRLLLARHPDLAHKKLVIKTAKPGFARSNEHAIDRLRREATILSRLDHERICPVQDVITEGDEVFVVMPFIEGETLESRLQRAGEQLRKGSAASSAWSVVAGAADPSAGRTTVREAPSPSTGEARREASREGRVGLRAILALMEEVAIAVHAAHEQGIVHRDLKPGNIMVRTDGHAVVLDFGLAVDLSDRQARRFTAYGDVLGTPSYMAPEQIQGDIAAIDRRTDVYALGAILYEVLTFRRAFKAAGVHALYQKILNGRVEPPRQANATIPRDLEAVCLKAMEIDPRRRYATALDFAEDLRRVRSLEATIARPISKLERIWRRIRRNPYASGAFATALALLIIAVAMRVGQWRAVGASTEAYAAFDRVRAAARQHKTPEPADDALVRSYFPDEQSYRLFLAAPDSDDEMQRFLAQVSTRLRTGAVVPGPVRLVAPRCGIVDRAPALRFHVDPRDPRRPTVRLLSADAEIPVTLQAGPDGACTASLAPGTMLATGAQYRWVVALPGSSENAAPEERWASFWVVDPAKRAEKLAGLKPAGDDALDVLVKASVLASLGLAQETLAKLATLPAAATPDQKRLALLLRTRSLDALGEKEAAEAAAAEYLGAVSRPGG